MLRMSLEYQLRRQMDEMQLQLGLLEEKNRALTHKTEKLEAVNKVLRETLTAEAKKNAILPAKSSCDSKMLISKLQNANEKRSNLAEFVAILQENLLELEHTSQVKSDILQKNIRSQQDRARKMKSALLEMIGNLTNFASGMRRKEQHLPIIGTNNIEDTQIQEFVAWAVHQAERWYQRSVAELIKIAESPTPTILTPA